MALGKTHPATAAEIAATLADATEDELEVLLARYAEDPRAQVRRACGVAQRRMEKQRAERVRVEGMYDLMRNDVNCQARFARSLRRSALVIYRLLISTMSGWPKPSGRP